MKTTLSGLPGSGKTTIAAKLAEKLGITYISAGSIFREMASEKGMSIEDFGKLAESDRRYDEIVDQRQRELAEKSNDFVAEGRLSTVFIDADIRVLLRAPLDERAVRVASRDDLSYEDALERVKSRERSESIRYDEYYGINVEDPSHYDLIIDTSKWNENGVLGIILAAIKNLRWKKS